MNIYAEKIQGIQDYDELLSFEETIMEPEKKRINSFAENKFIYEDWQKNDSELKKKLKEQKLDQFINKCQLNASGEFVDSESQRRAVEKFKTHKNNKDLRESLCQFDDILKNHYWSKSHQEKINKWFSGTEGSQAIVFAKMMNANI